MVDLNTILLAEDSARDIEPMLAAFAEHGLADRIEVVHAGIEALQHLRREGPHADRQPGRPAVLLLDLKMPRMDGLQAPRKIRADPDLKTLPMVIVTSSREEQDLLASYELDINAYVVKPVDHVAFIDAVKEVGVFWALIDERPADGSVD